MNVPRGPSLHELRLKAISRDWNRHRDVERDWRRTYTWTMRVCVWGAVIIIVFYSAGCEVERGLCESALTGARIIETCAELADCITTPQDLAQYEASVQRVAECKERGLLPGWQP